MIVMGALYYFSKQHYLLTITAFNRNYKYKEFPFSFEIPRDLGLSSIKPGDDYDANMVTIGSLSPSIITPVIRIYKGTITDGYKVKDIILDSKEFELRDFGSGVFIYRIPVNGAIIEIRATHKELIEEMIQLMEQTFRFKN